MPELPEVETIRRELEPVLGLTIDSVSVTGRRSVRRQPVEEFVARVTGQCLVGLRRWGKFLLVDLEDAEVLVIHLRMSGQLLLEAREVPRARHTHLVFFLSSEMELRFVDPRTFGECFVSEASDERGLPVEIAHLGIDPVVGELTSDSFDKMVKDRRIALKSLLLDQRVICGIGNIYGDEICARAGVRPTRVAGSLTRKERGRVLDSIGVILEDAIEQRGSTLPDGSYRNLSGLPGSYQDHHEVYGRKGLVCRRCGATIKGVVLGGRSAHFCPRCQR